MLDPSGRLLALFLLLGGSLLAGYAGHRLFRRYGVSDVIFLLLVGFLAGPVLGVLDPALLAPALPYLAPIGLAVVLFEGGLELAWKDVRQHAGRALAMSLATWLLGTAAVALVGVLLLGLTPVLATLLGAAVAATGVLVVVPLLQQLRAPSEARVMLTVETAVGDLLSAVVVTALASTIVLGASPAFGLTLLGAKFLVGAAVGLLAGLAWARTLHALGEARHGYPITLAALLLAYAVAEFLGGSGFLCALAFGLVVGNADALMRSGGLPALAPLPQGMRGQQSEIIFILRSVYFVFLGLAMGREILEPRFLVAGLALAGALLAARVVAVLATTRRGAEGMRVLLVAMMPRGLATAVIAGIPAAMGVAGAEGFLGYAFLVIVGCDIATSVGILIYRRRGARAADAGAVPLGAH